MTAVEVFKQSFAFYSRLFNKLIWLSIASSIAPLLVVSSYGDEQPPGLLMFFIVATSMFFSVYMMSLIHQFASNQDDSLTEAFSLTLKKVMPVTLTGFVFGLLVMLAIFPGAIVGSLLAAGIENENLRNVLVAIVIAIPVSLIMYRCFFAAYFTLVDGLSPIEALKASNQQVKGNKLIFRGFMLLSVVTLVYVILLVIFNKMIAVNPTALSFLEFVLNVLVMPFFSVFIYRLFALTKPDVSQEKEE
jgi:hypothetical protein